MAGVKTLPVRMKKEPRATLRAIRGLRGVDASIDFQGLIKSAALGWLSGAKTRYGFDRHAIREKAALLFTNRKVHVDTSKHVVDQNLELARAGAPAQTSGANWRDYPIAVPGCENAIVLLPGAGKANKLWPVERFRDLAKRIGPKALAVFAAAALVATLGARAAERYAKRPLATRSAGRAR